MTTVLPESGLNPLVDQRNVRSGTKIPPAAINTLTNGTVKQVICYINADFHDSEDTPAGTLAIHSVDSLVHPDSIPSSVFEHIILVPINDHPSHPNGYTDADFTGKEDLLQAAVPQYSQNPPSLDKRNPENNFDRDAWTPELGQSESSFAGIFKKMRSNNRDADYYIGVQVGAPLASSELKEALMAEGPVTYGKLLKDPRLHYVNYLALRNAKRLAYEIGFKLGLPIHHVEDPSAYTPTSYAAKPMRAEPRQDFQHTVSSIKPVQFKGEESVGIFHKVRPVEECVKHNLVMTSPYDGITMFSVQERPIGYAVPCDTGKRVHIDDAITTHPEISARHKGIVYEGNETALKVLAPNVYHSIDGEMLRGMDQMGISKSRIDTVSQFIPVLLKVSNIDLKRPQ
jgi:AraC-like DNA-binding protein